MKTWSFRQSPFHVFGVPFFEETGALERLPQSLAKQMESEWMLSLARRCPGARLCFRTDSKELTFRIKLESITPDIGMSIYSCQSGNVFIGPRQTARYAGLVKPSGYESTLCRRVRSKRAAKWRISCSSSRATNMSRILKFCSRMARASKRPRPTFTKSPSSSTAPPSPRAAAAPSPPTVITRSSHAGLTRITTTSASPAPRAAKSPWRITSTPST